MSAYLNFLYFQPSILGPFNSIQELADLTKVTPESRYIGASHVFRSMKGILIDNDIAIPLWESGVKPKLI